LANVVLPAAHGALFTQRCGRGVLRNSPVRGPKKFVDGAMRGRVRCLRRRPRIRPRRAPRKTLLYVATMA
jgi:hypothetical protein